MRSWRKDRRSSDCNHSSAIGSSFHGTSTGPISKTIVHLPKGCLKGQINKQSEDLLNKKSIESKHQKFVTFQFVFIREYERTIGDNPSCSRGAPIRYVIGRVDF